MARDAASVRNAAPQERSSEPTCRLSRPRREYATTAEVDHVRRREGPRWTVDFLKLWKHEHATYYERDVRSWEASHVGFTYAPIGGEAHQRVYRLQPGDIRDLTPESIYTALLASKRVPTTAEYAHKQLMKRLSKSPMASMSERLQDLYDGRRGGMGRR